MNKQEEIREGIENCILPQPTTRTWVNRNIAKELSKEILSYLHSKGVVIKVDKELPIPEYMYLDGHSDTHYITQNAFATGVSRDTQKKMLKAGYVAVEPLIRGVNKGKGGRIMAKSSNVRSVGGERPGRHGKPSSTPKSSPKK